MSITIQTAQCTYDSCRCCYWSDADYLADADANDASHDTDNASYNTNAEANKVVITTIVVTVVFVDDVAVVDLVSGECISKAVASVDHDCAAEDEAR